MKIKVTLQRSGGSAEDLQVTCDAATTVGDLAQFLRLSDPEQRTGPTPAGSASEPLTIGLVRDRHLALDPRTPLADSPIRSGAVISVTRAGELYADAGRTAVAVATVVAGPDAGQEFGLAPGTNIVGRVRGSEVCLSDPLVSRQHARLNVSDHVEVIDLGSANGVELNGSLVSREVVRPSDRIRIGDTELTVRMTQSAATDGRSEAGAVGFIRSPRLEPVFAGREHEVPELPERQPPHRFPMMMLLMPLLMAGVLLAVTKQASSILFAALSPLMMLGSWWEQRRSSSKVDRAALELFRADLAELVGRAEQDLRDEVAARLAEHPSTGECLDAVARRSGLLWSRRPDGPGFLDLRLGAGRLPSRSTVTLPDARRAPRDLLDEAARATEHLRLVDGVPVVAEPTVTGAVGVAGPRPLAMAAARALLLQAAALHSPAELAVAVVVSSRAAAEWDWLKWLPHVDAPSSPVGAQHLAATPAAASALVAAVEALVEERGAEGRGDGDAAVAPAVLLVVESEAPTEFGRLVELAERGRPAGVHVLWVAAEVGQLPAACRTYLDLRSPTDCRIGYVQGGVSVTPAVPELLGAEEALRAALALAPVVDLSARQEDSSDLPRRISFLALDGHEHLGEHPEAVLERWQQNHSVVSGRYGPGGAEGGAVTPGKVGSLRAVVGHAAGRLHAIDLRSDGPHALVGGTTGSGKSELLQTWILSMAASHSPQRLTFLLVDYKGGSAFADCARLPHTVGLVTDLNPNGVRRALTSLAAELRYREVLLHEHGAKDLMALERQGFPDAPPSLVIVVDEFAALVTEVPEFIDGVVNVAQRGRSLGLHLVLATQRPSGVIKDNLRANTNLRVALRVADEADSTDVLGSTEAAWFSQDLPGRAVSKTGPGRLVPFQTAYVGGHTVAGAQPPDIQVRLLGITGDTAWTLSEALTRADGPTGPTDIARVVDTIDRATAAAGMQPPRKPWLPDLAPLYDLADPAQVPSERRDDLLVFGIQDDPDRQRQVPVGFAPDQHGNLAVFGTGGSGKSTLLRTLAATAGVVARGGPCHVYGLDFGASGLSMLRDLPHVGAVISGGDEERVQRLVRWLRGLVTERAVRYAAVGAGTVTEYRQLSGQQDEPRILLLLDGLAAFRSAFETAANQAVADTLLALAAEGRPVGVHLVVTADRPGALPTALGSSIQQRVVLRMADPADYATLGVPADVLLPASPPGRAIVDEREVQVALLGRSGDTKSQADALAELARAMQNARVRPAPPVRRLPEQLPADQLPGAVDGLPVLGLSGADLEPATFDPRGSFVVSGPPGSGRSTALHAIAVALRRWDPRRQLLLLGADRRSVLAGLPLWNRVALGAGDVEQLARAVAGQLTEQYDRPGAPAAQLAVVLEGFPDLAASPDPAIADLVKAVLAADGLLVAEGEVSQLQASHGVYGAIKAGRTGLVLQPDQPDGFTVLKTQFPSRLRPQDFPVGRGLLARRGTVTTVQVMDPGRGTRDPHDRLAPEDLLVPAAYEPSSHQMSS